MRRMAEDILSLRAQLEAQQTENYQLHAHLAEHQDPGLVLLRDKDLDVMTKTEMADRIASLSHRLSGERSRTAAQAQRIQQLQSQLVRKSDSETELLRLSRALQKQPGLLQQQRRRMCELEATVRHQGTVIEKMERAQKMYGITTRKKQHGNPGFLTKPRGESEDRPAAESADLSPESHGAPTLPPPPSASNKATASDRDREDLMADLKRSETRRLILEQQLEENSKLWGKQKQQMLIHLSEHRQICHRRNKEQHGE